jgi:hypothetical protein
MSHSQTNSQTIVPMKNYLSSFALLLFALLLAIMQINAAAISVAEADDYHSSGSTAANSLV